MTTSDAKSACYSLYFNKRKKKRRNLIIYDGHSDGHNEHLAIQYDAKICQGGRKKKGKRRHIEMLRTPAGLSAIYSRLQYKSPYAGFFFSFFYSPGIPGRQKKALYINNDLNPSR